MKLSKGWANFKFPYWQIPRGIWSTWEKGKPQKLFKLVHRQCAPSHYINEIWYYMEFYEQSKRRQAVTWKIPTKFHLIKSIKRLPSLHLLRIWWNEIGNLKRHKNRKISLKHFTHKSDEIGFCGCFSSTSSISFGINFQSKKEINLNRKISFSQFI